MKIRLDLEQSYTCIEIMLSVCWDRVGARANVSVIVNSYLNLQTLLIDWIYIYSLLYAEQES